MTVTQEEMNQYIKNMYGTIGLPELEAAHAATVKTFLIENLSNIGRYSHRDFERFGNRLYQYPQRVEVHGRQDGWQALTKEVPHLDHLTYGTGILYIHGEMEIAPDEDDPFDPMINDEAYHVNRDGDQYVYQDVEEYVFWNDTPARENWKGEVIGNALINGDLGPIGLPPYPPIGIGYPETPEEKDKVEAWQGVIKATAGYRWEWLTEKQDGDTGSTDGDDKWTWATIKENQYGKGYNPKEDDKNNKASSVTDDLPPEFNDDEVYNLDNERHHYPFKIINSGQAKSVDTLLKDTLAGNNGMYDGKVPVLAGGEGISRAGGNWPPKRGGIKYPSGHEIIVDFISPIEETPGGGGSSGGGEGGDGENGGGGGGGGTPGKEYRDAFFWRNGIAVVFPETYPPNEVPPEKRAAFYEANLTDDQKYYDDPQKVPLTEWGKDRIADGTYTPKPETGFTS